MDSGRSQASPMSPGKSNAAPINATFYLEQLLWDKYAIECMPNVFTCVEKLLDEEIRKVKASLLNINEEDIPEHEPQGGKGPVVALSEKLYVPYKEFPEFNFVGRILGPRGMTAKQLEQKTGCKIMVRGKGSMRDKNKEDSNRGKPNWEHLNEDLHVLITVEDYKEIAEIKIEKAKREINKLLIPSTNGEDDLKKFQLMELAILNGTYRNDAYEIYKKSKRYDSNHVERRVVSSPFPGGVYYPHCIQGQGKSNKDFSDCTKSSPGSSIGMLGCPYQTPYSPYFGSNNEMAGVFYVDPYSPLAGSTYFGGQRYPESSSKTDCD